MLARQRSRRLRHRPMAQRAPTRFAGFLLSACVASCGAQPTPPSEYTREQLLDPESCRGCHQDYYDEWAASMHAYASRDPIFLAMNRRGNEETNGVLGNFCLKCHAPMAVLDEQTRNGS